MNDAPLPESEYQARRDRLAERMAEDGIDLVFVPPSSDLEYLTGLERDLPSFGQSSYAHGWVTGAFLAPGPRAAVRAAAHVRRVPPVGTRARASSSRSTRPTTGRRSSASALASLGQAERIGISARAPGARSVLELQAAAPQVEVVNATPLVNELRRVKSPAELDLMRKACAIVDEAMTAERAARAAGRDDGRPRRGGRAPAARSAARAPRRSRRTSSATATSSRTTRRTPRPRPSRSPRAKR